jgi:hypothetical protein
MLSVDLCLDTISQGDTASVLLEGIPGVLEELAKHEIVNVRHAHSDWNNPSLSGWAEKLHLYVIRPMQQTPP